MDKLGYWNKTDYNINMYVEPESSAGRTLELESANEYIGCFAQSGNWPSSAFETCDSATSTSSLTPTRKLLCCTPPPMRETPERVRVPVRVRVCVCVCVCMCACVDRRQHQCTLYFTTLHSPKV